MVHAKTGDASCATLVWGYARQTFYIDYFVSAQRHIDRVHQMKRKGLSTNIRRQYMP